VDGRLAAAAELGAELAKVGEVNGDKRGIRDGIHRKPPPLSSLGPAQDSFSYWGGIEAAGSLLPIVRIILAARRQRR
jgi:hypothetical protein